MVRVRQHAARLIYRRRRYVSPSAVGLAMGAAWADAFVSGMTSDKPFDPEAFAAMLDHAETVSRRSFGALYDDEEPE